MLAEQHGTALPHRSIVIHTHIKHTSSTRVYHQRALVLADQHAHPLHRVAAHVQRDARVAVPLGRARRNQLDRVLADEILIMEAAV